MKTKTMKPITRWSVLALTASVLACELPIDQLEVGDEDTGTDSGGDGDGDGGDGDGGDGDGEALECVVQGTNLAGGDQPIDFPLPECEVVCASGWGHGVAPLASEWTLDLEYAGATTGFTYLDVTLAGQLVAVVGHADAPAQLIAISSEGELQGEIEQPAIDGDVWGMAITDEGNIFVIWRDGEMQVLTALEDSGAELWTIELGSYGGQHSVLAALGSGVVVALNAAADLDESELLHVDSNGDVMGMGSIPLTRQIAVSPSGNTVVVANETTITWTDFELFPNGTSTQGVADADFVSGLVALDDERVASVGVAQNWDEAGSTHAYVKQIGPMGLEWEGRYDRALEWCADETDGDPFTTEHLYDVERLADASLLVVGSESGSGHSQPWIGHVSAQGEVLATDRGFWNGVAAAVTSTQDAGYVLLFEYDDAQQQHMYIRKYAL